MLHFYNFVRFNSILSNTKSKINRYLYLFYFDLEV